MRRISVRELQPGMALARAVHSERGELLLNADVPLTDRYINLLRDRGFTSVFVHDPDTDDVEIEDIVSERVHIRVTANLCRVYEAMEHAVDPLRDAAMPTLTQELQSADFARGIHEHAAFHNLQTDIEEIVDEVLGAEVLSGIAAIRSFDAYQFIHALDSTVAAVMIGRRLHFPVEDLRRIAAGSLLHDIGMVMVERAVLDKPGKLSPEELDKIRRHPEVGYEMLRKLRPNEVIPNHVAFQHHERQDGTGYPRGLHGNNRVHRGGASQPGRVLLDAEIVAVADVYDALGADRPYRAALAPDAVVRSLRRMAGGQLNREIVAHLLEVLPIYPLGADVVVVSGAHQHYRGIVSRVHKDQLDRPTIRLMWDRDGRRVPPFEVDLQTADEVITCVPMAAAEKTASQV